MKIDEEYKKIDEKEKIEQMKRDKEFLKWAKDFDKRNKYWYGVFKIMPKELQEQIVMAGSFFISNSIMMWLSVGDAKTRDIKSQLLKEYEDKIK